MRVKKYLRRGAIIICFAVTLTFTVLSAETAEAARKGLFLCGKVIVPTLFPVFMTNGMFIRLGGGRVLGRLLRAPFRLLGIEPTLAYPITVGLLCGAPSGITALSASVNEGLTSADSAERASPLCAMLSPSFVFSAVGCGMLGSRRGAAVLLASQLISHFTVSLIFLRGSELKWTAEKKPTAKRTDISAAFSESLAEATASIISVCGSVVFFSSLSGVVGTLPFIGDGVGGTITALLEISSGADAISRCVSYHKAFVLLCGTVSLSGLCVISQCVGAVKGSFSVRLLILGKIICCFCGVFFGFCAVFFGLV